MQNPENMLPKPECFVDSQGSVKQFQYDLCRFVSSEMNFKTLNGQLSVWELFFLRDPPTESNTYLHHRLL